MVNTSVEWRATVSLATVKCPVRCPRQGVRGREVARGRGSTVRHPGNGVGAGRRHLPDLTQERLRDRPRCPPVPATSPEVTYVGVLQAAGTIDYISDAISGLGAPLLAALLIRYLGGVASAFASSVALLGVMIPLAIPFLQQGGIGAVGFIVALAIATTVVDVSPFSTNGALIPANAQDIDRDRFYRQMLGYAAVVVVLGPLLAWAVFVLPGWL